VLGHDTTNLTDNHGGSQDSEVLFTPDDVVSDLQPTGLTVTKAGRVQRKVTTADGDRTAIDALLVARRSQRPRTPTRMLLAQRHDPRLDHRVHLMRTRRRHRRPIDQPREPVGRVAAQPALHGLARHTGPSRSLGHAHALVEHLDHRGVSLLHHIQLHQHDDPPGPTTSNQKHSPSASQMEHTYRSHCRPPTGPRPQSVTRLPEPPGKHLPGPHTHPVEDPVEDRRNSRRPHFEKWGLTCGFVGGGGRI